MYTLKLIYKDSFASYILRDSHTMCAVIHLMVDHNIDCVQSNDTTLEFESERDRFLAALALSDSACYTTQYGD